MVWLGVIGIAFGVVLLITTGQKQPKPHDRDRPPAR
jgi:hypothetical protein